MTLSATRRHGGCAAAGVGGKHDPGPGRTAGPPGRPSPRSFIGAHLLLDLRGADFLSLLDPPDWARRPRRPAAQHRCWPVLAGPQGQTDVLLVSPIILYDHPAVAPESSVALYDSTEIDEILTLRVLTLTDEEKAEARATDPRAAAIIDRCEAMSPEELQQLHGVLRNPHALDVPGPARKLRRHRRGTARLVDAGSGSPASSRTWMRS